MFRILHGQLCDCPLIQGWQDKYFDGAFAEQRANARDPDQNAEKYWFLMMKNALREMNGFASFIPSSGYYKFLDLGSVKPF